MKFSLQYAKLLSQKYLNIDDDIIPEIEMCLEREGDKVSIPYDVNGFGIAIYRSWFCVFGYGYNDGDCDNHGGGWGYGDYADINGDGNSIYIKTQNCNFEAQNYNSKKYLNNDYYTINENDDGYGYNNGDGCGVGL